MLLIFQSGATVSFCIFKVQLIISPTVRQFHNNNTSRARSPSAMRSHKCMSFSKSRTVIIGHMRPARSTADSQVTSDGTTTNEPAPASESNRVCESNENTSERPRYLLPPPPTLTSLSSHECPCNR